MSFFKVDLDALKNNFFDVRSNAPGTQVFCVVKANAYGCGAKQVATALQNAGADGFVVASVKEGVALRTCGVVKPIVVLGMTDKQEYGVLGEFKLSQSVFCEESFWQIEQWANQEKKRIDIWFKLNCGFNRVGFDNLALTQFLSKAKRLLPYLKVSAIFAHLRDGGATEKYRVSRAKGQFEEFCGMAKRLKKLPSFKEAKLSLLNSGGLRMGLPKLDVVRVGADLYGVGGKNRLVASFFAKVLQINRLSKGQSMGYDDGFVASKDTAIAVLDVGYADGLPRRASELGLRGFAGGEYRPFVGAVCMNHSFVEIEGDVGKVEYVEVMGKNVTPLEIAKKLNTVDYEIFCRFGKTADKIYLD